MSQRFSILLIGLAFLFLPAAPAQAQVADTVEITFILTGEDGQPVSGTTITLLLVKYTTSIERLPGGSCVTDAAGTCTIAVTDPPRMGDGRAEAIVQVQGYEKLIAFAAETQLEVRLSLSALGLVSTLTPREGPYEGQTEQPTDAPVISRTPPATRPAPTTTATMPPTPSATPEPTETLAPTETPIPTDTPPSPTPVPPPPAGGPGALTIVLVLLAVGIIGAIIWRAARQRFQARSSPKRDGSSPKRDGSSPKRDGSSPEPPEQAAKKELSTDDTPEPPAR